MAWTMAQKLEAAIRAPMPARCCGPIREPDRVRRVLRRLSAAERAEALRGLALLARASAEEIAGRGKGDR
jgi:hypothetical protein